MAFVLASRIRSVRVAPCEMATTPALALSPASLSECAPTDLVPLRYRLRRMPLYRAPNAALTSAMSSLISGVSGRAAITWCEYR